VHAHDLHLFEPLHEADRAGVPDLKLRLQLGGRSVVRFDNVARRIVGERVDRLRRVIVLNLNRRMTRPLFLKSSGV